MHIDDIGADLRPHDRVIRIVVELNDAAGQRARCARHSGLQSRGRQHLMEIRLRVRHGLPAHGMAAHPLKQLLGIRQMVNPPPNLRQRHRRGLDHGRLAVDLVLGFVIDAKLPRHHQLLVIDRRLARSFDLDPLLEQARTIFQRLKHAKSEGVIGIGALPGARQRLGDHRGALQVIFWIGSLKINREF